MLQNILKKIPTRFSTSAEVRETIIAACKHNSDIATYYNLGESEQGRSIDAVIIGSGKKTISLLAGAHSDEPVGPETLRTFILEGLPQRENLRPLLQTFRFVIIPHINPDGEAQNQPWIQQWPDIGAYLQHAFRERPGRDLEFGYPDMRIENRLISQFLEQYAPFSLHLSLHGMGFSEGPMLLIERHWIEATRELQSKFIAYTQNLGLSLHDHDRKGEKGFLYIGPGFTTTPEGKAMQAYFRSRNDEVTAQLFHLSSMEYVRNLGGNPLCLVTELPLFIIGRQSPKKPPGIPVDYLDFRNQIPELQRRLSNEESIGNIISEFKIQPFDLQTAIRFQLFVIQLGLDVI